MRGRAWIAVDTADYLTSIGEWIWRMWMRRHLHLRVKFCPTRRSPEYLRTAYECIVPMKKVAANQQAEVHRNEVLARVEHVRQERGHPS